MNFLFIKRLRECARVTERELRSSPSGESSRATACRGYIRGGHVRTHVRQPFMDVKVVDRDGGTRSIDYTGLFFTAAREPRSVRDDARQGPSHGGTESRLSASAT